MAQRLIHRHRHTYSTRSNKTRIVRTPGGKLVYQYRAKKAAVPKCGDCGHALNGIPALRPKEYARLKPSQRTVSRAYGGTRCSGCVRNRILRAFLCEERKLVKKALQVKKAATEVAPVPEKVESKPEAHSAAEKTSKKK
jgi:large subunit ribosomal protein L34e